jgi:hypothetical protein
MQSVDKILLQASLVRAGFGGVLESMGTKVLIRRMPFQALPDGVAMYYPNFFL